MRLLNLMWLLEFTITSIHLAFRRGENLTQRLLAYFYIGIGIWAFWTDRDVVMAVALIGFMNSMYQIQFAALRKEIRAKKMWHGGE